MTIPEAIALIKNDRIPPHTIARWADLGCGSGLFTHALSTLLPAGSTVYGVDSSPALENQTTPGGVHIIPVKADFVTAPLPFDKLDGIIMANALHYVKDKPAFFQKIQSWLKKEAPVILVEYDTDTPVRTWVPYPLSFASLQKLVTASGYASIKKLATHSSVYGNGGMYAALIG